jgi:hypothetical protein
MSAAIPIEGYASGLYTDLKGRLVFYAAFEDGGGVCVAALVTEGPMRTSGDLVQLEGTTLVEIGSIGPLAAKLIVDADLRPRGRRSVRIAMDAAAALGFVGTLRSDRMLPDAMRCTRWEQFRDRAGRGVFAAWSMGVLTVLPDLEANHPILPAADRIVARWPILARRLASPIDDTAAAVLEEALADDHGDALVDLFVVRPQRPLWVRERAVAFVRSVEGLVADVEMADMVDLAGHLPIDRHPVGVPDLVGFDGAAALFGEMRRRHLLPRDAGCLFSPYAADWTKAPARLPFGFGDGAEETADDAFDRLQRHVVAMGRRFGVPAWLEMTMPEFRDLPARTADNLVQAVLLAACDAGGAGMEPMAEVFLRDLDLQRLLCALRISPTSMALRPGSHIVDVEGSFREAEAAGEFAGRLAPRLGTGGARRIGLELLEAGFGAGIDVARIGREIGMHDPETPSRRPMAPSPAALAPASRRPAPKISPVRMAAAVFAGVLAAICIVNVGSGPTSTGTRSVPSGKAAAVEEHRPPGRESGDWTSLSRLVDRRDDIGRAVRSHPAPCPTAASEGRVCGRFGDLTFVLAGWGSPRPSMAAYVVEGRFPVEVLSWSSTAIRQPSAVWTRHLLDALGATAAADGLEANAEPTGDSR